MQNNNMGTNLKSAFALLPVTRMCYI